VKQSVFGAAIAGDGDREMKASLHAALGGARRNSGKHGATMCVDARNTNAVGQEINANHVRPAHTGLVTVLRAPCIWGGAPMSGSSTS